METQRAILCTQVQPTATVPDNTPQKAGKQLRDTSLEAVIHRAAHKARLEGEKAAAKKMGGVFKSMLLQCGVKEEDVSRLTAEWAAQQQTAEERIAGRNARIAQLEHQLEELRQKDLMAQKRLWLQKQLEEEGLHPDVVKLLQRFISLDEVELGDGALKAYEALMAPVRRESPALFGMPDTARRCPCCPSFPGR